MKTLPVQGESKETSVPFNHVYQCDSCKDSKEIVFDESDGEGHYAPTGIKKCDMCGYEDEDEPDTL